MFRASCLGFRGALALSLRHRKMQLHQEIEGSAGESKLTLYRTHKLPATAAVPFYAGGGGDPKP